MCREAGFQECVSVGAHGVSVVTSLGCQKQTIFFSRFFFFNNFVEILYFFARARVFLVGGFILRHQNHFFPISTRIPDT